MQHTGKVELNMVVNRINERFQLPLSLDHDAQGYRLYDRKLGRLYSPRLKPTMMRLWLEAFEEGLSYKK